MKIEQLFEDYRIEYQTEGHKHCRPGWVNRECPFCVGNPGMHLGYNLRGNYFQCWRCGRHNTTKTISILIKVNYAEAEKIIKKYGGKSALTFKQMEQAVVIKSHILPSGVTPLLTNHKKYLEGRGFDPEKLEDIWNLTGTGPLSTLDDIDYRFRILAPIMWNEQQVSFQTRDISNLSDVKYMACPQDREIIQHKHILYGKQSEWGDIGICVEGITDVWRLGPTAFATFGIKYTMKQVIQIKKHFKRVVILFDDDPQAQIQAKKLNGELLFWGVDSVIFTLDGDPGDMAQDDANHFVKNVTNSKIWDRNVKNIRSHLNN